MRRKKISAPWRVQNIERGQAYGFIGSSGAGGYRSTSFYRTKREAEEAARRVRVGHRKSGTKGYRVVVKKMATYSLHPPRRR